MEKNPAKYMMSVQVSISNAEWASGTVQIREEVPTKPLDFRQMAEVLEAFHVLVEKYRA